MTLNELSDADLDALMNETFRQLEFAEGMQMIVHSAQLKLEMQKQAAKWRAAFHEAMAEYDSRREPIGEMSLDELRQELSDFA